MITADLKRSSLPPFIKVLATSLLCIVLGAVPALAQVRVGVGNNTPAVPATNALTNYADPKEYEIAALTVSGTRFLDPNSLASLTGLKAGDKIRIPGEAIGSILRKLMDSGLLDNVELEAPRVEDNKVWLNVKVQERPRLYRITYVGVKKGEQETLKGKTKLNIGKIISNTITKNTQLAVRKFFIDKGYLNTKVKTTVIPDSTRNNATMRVTVDKGDKVKIQDIEFENRKEVAESQIRSKMKATKQMRFGRVFSPSNSFPRNTRKTKAKWSRCITNSAFGMPPSTRIPLLITVVKPLT